MHRHVGNLSLVAGSLACNAKCPFCVARMTPAQGQSYKFETISLRNLRKAIALADKLNAVTALITSKGEPTLAPEHIDTYLDELGPIQDGKMPIRELQSNGLLFFNKRHRQRYQAHLERWAEKGLSTIALSLVSTEESENAAVYTPGHQHYDLAEMIAYLHSFGYSVRLSMVMLKGRLDTIERVEQLIQFAKENDVDQLTMRPVARPDNTADQEAGKYVIENGLDEETQVRPIEEHLIGRGAQLEILPHGAVVLDIDGQNVCLTNCLTVQPTGESLRQLIFFPNGTLSYAWQHEGAILIGPDRSLASSTPELVQLSQ